MPDLWLSRSWTTRPRRPGEPASAYVWVSRDEFMAHVAEGGFLEWAEYLGNLYGSPVPEVPAGTDVLLEIELQGARQVLEACPDAVVILLLPPTPEIQRARLVARGDPDDHVQRRLAMGVEEVRRGRELAAYQVVNGDLEQALDELAGIVSATRGARAVREASESGRREPV